MAETAAGGCERNAARSAARTRPLACAIGTDSEGSGSTSSSTRESACSTESSAMSVLGRVINAGFAAALLDESNPLDAHAAFDCLRHVVDGEAGDRDRGERFHLDAGLSGHLGGGANDEAGQLAIGLDLAVHLGERERM